jgi:hypothetical protein
MGRLTALGWAPMHVSERHGTRGAEALRSGGWPSITRRLADPRALNVLAVVVLTCVGFAVRLAIAGQPLFADELATYWIISTNGLGGVVSTVHSDAEITPPLFFAAAWLTTQIDLTPELVRAPSLLAGAASIPLIYLLGLRTVRRPAALVAAGLTALSPFLIYYSAEARGYALMTALVVLSTLAMLLAVEARRTRWWLVYGACSCGAVYSHYTSVFVLAAQFLWLVWAHPEARRPALLANIGAVVAFVPWLSGLRADLDSPTTEILSELTPFDWGYVGQSLSHAAVGYPYQQSTGLDEVPGIPALVLLGLAVALAVAGLAVTALRRGPGLPRVHLSPPLILVVVLALSAPIGEAIASAIGTNVLGARNLNASVPAFILSLAALLMAAGPWLRLLTAALALGAFALGAAKLLDEQYQRPNYKAAAELIDSETSPGDVVIDAAVLSPGPYSPLDVSLRGPHRVIRSGAPAERTRPFGLFDRVVPREEAAARAIAAADGRRIFVVAAPEADQPGLRGKPPSPSSFRPRYRLVETRTYPGTPAVLLQVWAERSSSPE